MVQAILAPYVASMDLSGVGYVEKLQHATVAITAIEFVFGAGLGDIAKKISVKNTDPAAGDAGLTVEWSDSTGDAFAAELATQMALAEGGAAAGDFATGSVLAAPAAGAAGAQDMQEFFLEKIRDEINEKLANNEVLAYLESDVVGGLTLNVDWSAGAENMRDGLGATGIELMFLQLVNRLTPVSADASGNAIDRTLNDFLEAGDILAFVFDVATTVAITTNTQNAPTMTNATATAADDIQIAASYGSSLSYGGDSKRVGFVFTK